MRRHRLAHPKRRELIAQIVMTQLHHSLWARHATQRITAQIRQPNTVGQPIHHQRFGHPRQHRLTAMRQIAQPRGPIDRRARIVGLVTQLDLAGVHPNPDPDRGQRRPLQCQRTSNRVRCTGERGHEAVALALFQRAHPAVSGERCVHRLVEQRQRGGHLFGLGFP